MPGRLRCDELDIGDPEVVRRLVQALSDAARNQSARRGLATSKKYYFSVPADDIPSEPGWYVICDATGVPLYVGTASDLNGRLNTENGSRDQFANPKRASDSERNFIKAYADLGIIDGLIVVVIPESAVCASMGVRTPLSRRDRHNVEKILNLFRASIAVDT